ncbi:MAG: TerC family protein [Myxococcales bacterium]|nr:TerC family protein [Myxococcales bacterium]
MFELLTHPDNWLALLSLTALEIVLGIDNIVFIAILTARLPEAQQALAYRLGLIAAMGSRLLLLLAIAWVMGLKTDFFEILGEGISGRDLILIGGGLFLIGKSTHEIYEKVEGFEEEEVTGWAKSLWGVVAQIMVLDIVFSLDSVITAVGMVDHVEIMAFAVIVAVGVMLLFAQSVGNFVNRNPSMKVLALSFLLLIGVLLVAEGLDQHINKGYIYFAMGFALLVEIVNMRVRRKERARRIAAAFVISERPEPAPDRDPGLGRSE